MILILLTSLLTLGRRPDRFRSLFFFSWLTLVNLLHQAGFHVMMLINWSFRAGTVVSRREELTVVNHALVFILILERCYTPEFIYPFWCMVQHVRLLMIFGKFCILFLSTFHLNKFSLRFLIFSSIRIGRLVIYINSTHTDVCILILACLV